MKISLISLLLVLSFRIGAEQVVSFEKKLNSIYECQKEQKDVVDCVSKFLAKDLTRFQKSRYINFFVSHPKIQIQKSCKHIGQICILVTKGSLEKEGIIEFNKNNKISKIKF